MTTLNLGRREELILKLGPQLKTCEQVTPPPGVTSGWSTLDQFLLWKGFPKGALTLMVSECGGATSLWARAASEVTRQGQWAAWMNDAATWLTPWALRQRKVDLKKLVYVSPARDEKQMLWALQELMSLGLFEIIGCDLGEWELKDHQVLKLKKLALRHQIAIVFVTRRTPRRLSSFFALILQFQRAHVQVIRALHRFTPHTLERKELYADTLPQLAAGRHALCG